MLLSAERPIVGAFAVGIPRAVRLYRNGLVQVVPPASRNMCKRTMGVPQELVEILSSPRQHSGRSYRVTNSRPRRRTRPSRSERNECNRGTANRRKRIAAGWAARSRSTLIVLMKPGELVPQDPVEGRKNRKGVSDVGPWAGKYVRGFVLGTPYHRHDPG